MIPFYENKFDDLYAIEFNSLNFPPHLHDLIECIYVMDGRIDITIDSQICHLTKGNLAVIFPNTVHSYSSDGGLQNCCTYLFYPVRTKSRLYSLVHNRKPASPILFPDEVHKDVPGLFRKIVFLYENQPDRTILLETLAELLLLRVIDRLNLEKNSCSGQDGLVEKAVRYLAENFRNTITLEGTAKHLGVSKYYLSHVLNNSLGMNFFAYINILRVDYAKTLLTTTDLSVSEVATQSGYDSLRTFNRCFKNITGLTPKDFRRASGSSSPQES